MPCKFERDKPTSNDTVSGTNSMKASVYEFYVHCLCLQIEMLWQSEF